MCFVIVPPIIEVGPSDEIVAVNDSVTFYCNYNSAIPTTVTWYHNGDIISDNITTNDTTSTLSLYNIALTDSGTYTCEVVNDAGVTNASAILQVGKLFVVETINCTVFYSLIVMILLFCRKPPGQPISV